MRVCVQGHPAPPGVTLCPLPCCREDVIEVDDAADLGEPGGEPLPLAPPRVVLGFAGGDVRLAPGEQAALGRNAGKAPLYAPLFAAHTNVSRLHATAGMNESGTMWIRDEGSLNGTFVNDERLVPGAPRQLSVGDTVRLALDAKGEVRELGEG